MITSKTIIFIILSVLSYAFSRELGFIVETLGFIIAILFIFLAGMTMEETET
jgi:hypothetical protein